MVGSLFSSGCKWESEELPQHLNQQTGSFLPTENDENFLFRQEIYDLSNCRGKPRGNSIKEEKALSGKT